MGSLQNFINQKPKHHKNMEVQSIKVNDLVTALTSKNENKDWRMITIY